MSVSDLTGYTWVGNSSISISSSFSFHINFVSNSNNYILITSSYDGEDSGLYYEQNNVGINVWNNRDFWCQSEAYKTINITGGTDATNATLIAWLEANGTLTAPATPSGKTKLGTLNITKKMFGTLPIVKEVVGGMVVYEGSASGYSVTVTNDDTGVPLSFRLYDGQNNSGIYLGALEWGGTQTFTITSGYIYGEWVETTPDILVFYNNGTAMGNPVQITTNIGLIGIGENPFFRN